MKNIGVNCLTSPDKYVESHEEGIEEDLEKIRGDKVQYKQWKRVKMNDGKERMKIVDIEKGKDEFKDEMRYQFTEFREHVSRVKAQYSAVRKMKDQLPTNHVLVQMDFAENYSCQNLDEIQSAYWNTTMVTLHPTIVYHRQPDGTLVHSSYVFVSFESKYKVKASWHYFEAGHGKGPCDGIGGTTKRNADNAVKQGKATIQDANDFFAWACSETSSNIKYKFIQTEDFEVTKGEVEQRTKVIVPVKGTMKIHAVVGVADGTVRTRDVSCVCPECFGETGFKDTTSCHWDVASLRKNEAQAQSTACQSSAAEPNSTDITENTINVTE
ncbi:hypothetical protein FSP39_007894 [Pinctada imbricata]|uniref:Uncharacterized protein n=1 Tax=Pinctada imbricata TaxID=66713 RepID=A0AA89BT12_PINIB|nr:hypothetical protein FSP39_007894 [Pinctada imbricata]